MALQRYRAAREQSRLEAKAQALEFFLSSIRDPHNPRHCATCLDGAFRECSDARQWHPYMGSRGMMKMFQDSQTYNPQLWNAVLQFLFIKRTNKQMRRLLTSLSECNCRMDEQVRRYHEMSIRRDKNSDWRTYIEFFESESEDGQRFVEVWRVFLSNLFLNLSVPIVRGGSRTTSKGSSSFWPHSPMDLIPYGAETLVDSMLRWHQFFSDPLLIHLMGRMVVVCRELVYPSLVKYRFTARVVASTRKFIDRSISAYLARPHLPYSLSNPRPPEHEYLRHVLIWQIADIVHYLDACFFNDDYEEVVFRDCEIKVVQLCCLILYLFPPLQDYYGLAMRTFQADTLAKIGQELFCRFNMYGTAPPSFLVHPVIALVDWNFTLSPEESASVQQDTRLVQTLRMCYKDMRCFARGCMNSLQTSGKDFRRCGKCSVATYCGQECQAASWRDEEHPHKRVCPIIVDLLEKAGDPTFLPHKTWSDSGEFTARIQRITERWRDHHVEASDMTIVSDWFQAVRESRGQMQRDLKELSPGFPDYDHLISMVSKFEDGAPEPVYLGGVHEASKAPARLYTVKDDFLLFPLSDAWPTES